MSAALVLALALLAPQQEPPPGRFREAEIELQGPLDAVRCEVPGRGATRLVARLVPGERRTAVVPIAATARDGDLVLAEAPERDGSARWTAWLRERTSLAARQWDSLPGGLRARPLPIPPPEEGGRRVRPVALLAALAWLPVAWTLRRRRAALLSSAAAGAAVVLGLGLGGARAPARDLRVIEIDGSTRISVIVQIGRNEIEVPREPPLQLLTIPPHVPVEAELDLDGGPWRLAARGATFLRWTEPSGEERERLIQRLGSLRYEAAWTRSADGVWTAEGGGAASPDPPGWLNPALPLGVRARIGKLARDPEHPARETWVRAIGG